MASAVGYEPEFVADLRPLDLWLYCQAKDVRLWVEGDGLMCRARPGVLTPELKAAIAARKPQLIALLSDEAAPADPAESPASETPPPRPVVLALVAQWSDPWRQLWGDRANALQFKEGHSQDNAERTAFAELLPQRIAQGLAAKGRYDEPGPDS
jgi:hypothetical protein